MPWPLPDRRHGAAAEPLEAHGPTATTAAAVGGGGADAETESAAAIEMVVR